MSDDDEADVDRARRRLLRAAVYVPPIVLGVIAMTAKGCAPPASCAPSTCHPNGGPCGPSRCPPNR